MIIIELISVFFSYMRLYSDGLKNFIIIINLVTCPKLFISEVGENLQ